MSSRVANEWHSAVGRDYVFLTRPSVGSVQVVSTRTWTAVDRGDRRLFEIPSLILWNKHPKTGLRGPV